MKGGAIIAAAFAVLAGLLVFVFVQFQEGGKAGGVRMGVGSAEACNDQAPRCLPRMMLLDTRGRAWPPEAVAKKLVVVNVWATWCRPCEMEIPDLVAVNRDYRDRGVILFGFLADDVSPQELEAFVSRHGIDYPIVPLDDDLARAFDYPQALPTTFIYDRSGRMRYGRPGMITRSQLESTLDDLLRE